MVLRCFWIPVNQNCSSPTPPMPSLLTAYRFHFSGSISDISGDIIKMGVMSMIRPQSPFANLVGVEEKRIRYIIFDHHPIAPLALRAHWVSFCEGFDWHRPLTETTGRRIRGWGEFVDRCSIFKSPWPIFRLVLPPWYISGISACAFWAV